MYVLIFLDDILTIKNSFLVSFLENFKVFNDLIKDFEHTEGKIKIDLDICKKDFFNIYKIIENKIIINKDLNFIVYINFLNKYGYLDNCIFESMSFEVSLSGETISFIKTSIVDFIYHLKLEEIQVNNNIKKLSIDKYEDKNIYCKIEFPLEEIKTIKLEKFIFKLDKIYSTPYQGVYGFFKIIK